ncbi:MAG: DUF2071 domain-containing protein [Fimbriimonadaceae bacterium]|nr:DUF2071 domain-containing protein [Fimbriimonadaceae bacterium]
MLELDRYEKLRARPPGRAVMRQSWRDLLFLHFRADPAVVQASLPLGFTVDTFPDSGGREHAWVGLVAFRMQGIRPTLGFPLPWLSAFPETNVRTYVTRNGGAPGVWFYRLDAARWPACAFARLAFGLPYVHSTMKTSSAGNLVRYRSETEGPPCAQLSLDAFVGAPVAAPPDSLEFFLVERYLLYSVRRGRLCSGRVAHPPYPLRNARVLGGHQNLTDAVGFPARPWDHVCFSPGVDVEVFGLRPG